MKDVPKWSMKQRFHVVAHYFTSTHPLDISDDTEPHILEYPDGRWFYHDASSHFQVVEGETEARSILIAIKKEG